MSDTYHPTPAKLILRFSGASVINEKMSNSAARNLSRRIFAVQDQHKQTEGRKMSGDDLADLLSALLLHHEQEQGQ